jgi:hypothetical protein
VTDRKKADTLHRGVAPIDLAGVGPFGKIRRRVLGGIFDLGLDERDQVVDQTCGPVAPWPVETEGVIAVIVAGG